MNQIHRGGKPQNDRDQQKVILVAELYYIEHLTQQEISDRLGLSRPWVSKLLKRAEETGVVRIEVLTPTAGIGELQQELVRRFGLSGALVVKNNTDANSDPAPVARAAANHLISILEPADVIGISWGRTLAAIAEQLFPLNYSAATVVPLVGGMGRNPEILSNQIATRMSAQLGGQCFLLHAPAFTVGSAEAEVFRNDPSIQATLTKGEQVDVAILGLGSLRGSTMLERGYITEDEVAELEALGAVGDIALRFIDREGRLISHPIHDRLVAAPLQRVREHARVVLGVGAGVKKVPVVRAALLGHWLDVLVTDGVTACALLD